MHKIIFSPKKKKKLKRNVCLPYLFSFTNQNICCGYPKGSFVHSKQMLKLNFKDKKMFNFMLKMFYLITRPILEMSKCKKDGKDQETIQSITPPDPGYHMGK